MTERETRERLSRVESLCRDMYRELCAIGRDDVFLLGYYERTMRELGLSGDARQAAERPGLIRETQDGKRRVSIAELFTFTNRDGRRVTLCADELEAAGGGVDGRGHQQHPGASLRRGRAATDRRRGALDG